MTEEYVYDELDCSCNQDFVKCPYCGFEDEDVYDGLDFDADTYVCSSCGKTFGFSVNQTIEFNSWLLEEVN